jgi:methylated-DNA-[protein]-cysteine S-methyltransferase
MFVEMRERLCDYFAGLVGEFRDIELEMGWAGEFTQKVLRACREIKFGETLTYGELAVKVGNAGAARAVGQALGRNRLPVVVPCHRVVAADGSFGGYSGRDGVEMKKRLLRHEKVHIDEG